MFKKRTKQVCTQCGNVGYPKSITKGNIGFELILWLLFIIPGLIYSIWRHTTTHKACRVCKNKNMIPVDSPMGKKKLAEFNS
ncbi:hypothetical protein CL684_02325 [Candidatus Campbellbacteria bacterium]|nr:hypothetical protein [Candidatus Campbellbacteria bacterium]